MKKLLGLAVVLTAMLVITSCGSTPKLYSWYNYQSDYYNYVKKQDEKSLKDLLETYQKIIDQQKETRGIVPPGIYADYGYFLIESGKKTEGKAMLAKELELYPESAVYVEAMLKRVK